MDFGLLWTIPAALAAFAAGRATAPEPEDEPLPLHPLDEAETADVVHAALHRHVAQLHSEGKVAPLHVTRALNHSRLKAGAHDRV